MSRFTVTNGFGESDYDNLNTKYENVVSDNLNDKVLQTSTYVIQNDDPRTIKGDYSLINNIAGKEGENIYIYCGAININDKKSYYFDKSKILYEDIQNGVYYFYVEGEPRFSYDEK